jgi:hypothetical protein
MTDVWSQRGVNSDAENYLMIAKLREALKVSKQAEWVIYKWYKKLSDMQAKQELFIYLFLWLYSPN